LELSKNTYYTSKDSRESFEEKYDWVRKHVEKVIEKHSHYGIRRIKEALLKEEEVTIGRDVLGKLLVLWGLNLRRKIRKSKPSMIERILKMLRGRANLLIRAKITEPFQAITSDITEIVFGGGKAYLCVHKDVFGQYVYGHELGLDMKKELVLGSLEKAIRRLKKFGVHSFCNILCHQDQGSQYTSYEYIENVLDSKMKISFSKKGTPTENPGQESFYGRFKTEWKDEISEIETFEELQKFIKSKITYYNERRLHTSIGYESPRKFTESFLSTLRNRFNIFRT